MQNAKSDLDNILSICLDSTVSYTVGYRIPREVEIKDLMAVYSISYSIIISIT